MLSIRVDEEKCIGCGLCSLVCSLVHGGLTSGGSIGQVASVLLASVLPPARVTIRRVEAEGGSGAAGDFAAGGFRIDICRHCEEPLCAAGCVSGAFRLDMELGIVELDRSRCVGCWTCVLECPFGAVSMPALPPGQQAGARALKCDGCRDAGAPQCTRFCPTGALAGGGRQERVTARRRREHVLRRDAAARE